MSLPMVGSWNVRVSAVRPFTIHGDVYFEVLGVRVEDGSELNLRVPQHATTEPIVAGQELAVTFLMGQVTGVKRLVG